MRRFAAWGLPGIAVLAVALWWFGPYEPVTLRAGFDPARFGADVQAYFDRTEGAVPGITPGTEKRVIWAGAQNARTTVAVVYLHGFSATSEEIRPVPDQIAAALGANLVFTRLAGHGLPGTALAQATVADWVQDTAEALAAGRAVGDRVVVLATSTGATLAVAAALDADMSRDVAAFILVSPNFGINNPLAPLLTWPGARYWLPLIAGRERSFEASSAAQAKFWTTRYPSSAVMPMAALVSAVAALDVTQARIPALFWFSSDDDVVRPDLTAQIAARWGGPVTVRTVTMGPGDDANAHVVTGDIKSPGQTALAAEEMVAWLNRVLN